MDYSIVVPSYNSERTILRCLSSLKQQHFNEACEIIVVDSSSDRSPELIRKHFPKVTLLHLPEQTIPGTARNFGIERAQGDIICFIDSDCIASPDWLNNMARIHRQEDYAAVGGAVANGNPECLVGWAGYFAEFREFFPFHPSGFMPNIPSCNISYKRRVFEQYGNFPDLMPDSVGIKHPQQEDLLLNLRLVTHGEQIFFDPAIQVAHINMTHVKRFSRHQYRLGRNTSYLLRHFDMHGSFIARSRLLSLLSAPLLPCVKFFNTLQVACASREYLRRFIAVSPLLFGGLLLWELGFIRGTHLPRLSPASLERIMPQRPEERR